jgi:hypothetical protein
MADDDQGIGQLLGENFASDPLGLGSDLVDPDDLTAGYIPERSILYVPQTIIGDGLAGPVNDQMLMIGRDTRPLAVDELGKQGPFQLEIGKWARHRAGRMFPLNYDWGAGLDPSLPEAGMPLEEGAVPSVLSPEQSPDGWLGVPPVEIIADAHTVYYTASPNVGWGGDG